MSRDKEVSPDENGPSGKQKALQNSMAPGPWDDLTSKKVFRCWVFLNWSSSGYQRRLWIWHVKAKEQRKFAPRSNLFWKVQGDITNYFGTETKKQSNKSHHIQKTWIIWGQERLACSVKSQASRMSRVSNLTWNLRDRCGSAFVSSFWKEQLPLFQRTQHCKQN